MKLLYVKDVFSLTFSPKHKRSTGVDARGSEVARKCYCAVSEGLTLMIDHHGYDAASIWDTAWTVLCNTFTATFDDIEFLAILKVAVQHNLYIERL